MAGKNIPREVFKSRAEYECLLCHGCEQLLDDPVQLHCGDRFCKSCADEIIRQSQSIRTFPKCPKCGEKIDDEDGACYFPDRFAKKEINSLAVICPFSEAGCKWEGRVEDYVDHINICSYSTSETTKHIFGYSNTQKHFFCTVEQDTKDLVQSTSVDQKTPKNSNKEKNLIHKRAVKGLCAVSVDPRIEELESKFRDHFESFQEILKSIQKTVASLRFQISNLEKRIQSKNAELEDRDFRLSLLENSNHDGSMIWKIPQFSQRKADAVNGKYTSIFSLPFHSGRYGYKMCLRLYIMGDGIGKGTHLSLFFVVMRGEFDNILQWPFTHKVTFKLLNQAGGRDIVDTFQPDPMSSSFRKPKSDMNIASGCPRFVSHTELERGGFIVDDTIFIKCNVDVATIRHP